METQNKLETHHVAKRLPYGLKGVLTSDISEDYSWQDWADEEILKIFKKGIIWDFCGYAPSDLQIPLSSGGDFGGFIFRNGYTWTSRNDNVIKPLLFPLSSLTETITIKGESFVPIDELEIEGFIIGVNSIGITISQEIGYEFGHVMDVYENIILKLLEWHIDLPNENLIEKGLAISVFDLDKNPYAL